MGRFNFRFSPLVTYLLALATYGALMLTLSVHRMQEIHPRDGLDLLSIDDVPPQEATRLNGGGWIQKAEDFYHHLAKVKTQCRKMVRFGGSACKKYLDNEKFVCLDKRVALKPGNCIVYSFGVGDDISFDDAASRYGCEVFMFDPSLNSTIQKELRDDLLPNQHFYNLGLSDVTEEQSLTLRTGETLVMEMVTYDDIKRRLGHKDKVVNYLKIDIEGFEWKSLEYMFARGLLDGVQQLSMEIHTKDIKYVPQEKVVGVLQKYWKTLSILESLGFQRVFYRDNPVLESIYRVPDEPGKILATAVELLYLRK